MTYRQALQDETLTVPEIEGVEVSEIGMLVSWEIGSFHHIVLP